MNFLLEICSSRFVALGDLNPRDKVPEIRKRLSSTLIESFLTMASRVTRSRRQPLQHQEQQSRARWTASLTKILADLMVDQVQKGNRRNNSFGKKSWRYMCDEFYKKTGLKWDKEQLKNRYAVLRRQYVTVKLILDRDDFIWDKSTGIIIAGDQVWADYIRGHPDAETVKSSGCPIYKELCTIFSELATNGKFDHSIENDAVTRLSYPFPEPLGMNEEESSSESEEVDDVTDDQETTLPTTPSTSSNRKRRKGVDGAIAGAILEMAAASKLRTAAALQINAKYTITDCIKELDEMQGLEEQIYFAALDLFNKPTARETFLSLKRVNRLTWLRLKCTAQSVF